MGIDNRVVGAAITQLRMQAELTQQQLSSILNVSHQAVSKWENGAALPDIQTLLSITQLFGVTMEQLLTGDIPKAEAEPPRKEEPSLASWFRGAVSEETRRNLNAFAEDARRAATDIVEKVGNAIGLTGEDEDDGTVPDMESEEYGEDSDDFLDDEDEDGEDEDDEDEDDEDEDDEDEDDEDEDEDEDDVPHASDPRETVTIEKLISLAPFMTKAKLSEAAMALADCEDWDNLKRLAPFLSRETLGQLVRRSMAKPTDRKYISSLAPFMRSDDLFDLIVSNIELFSFQDLRSLAPHLRREKVDQLFTYFSTGEFPKTESAPAKNPPNLGSIIDNALNGIGNAVTGFGNAVNDAIGSICPKPKAADSPKSARAPSEFKDRIARAALSAGNWQWLNAHLNEIGDKQLLSEIALTAIKPENYRVLSPMAVQIAPLLEGEAQAALFSEALKSSNWEFLASIKDCAAQNTADLVVSEAANVAGGERESAYAVIELYAPKISRELLEQITEKAIREDNWLLISALTESL